MVMADSQARVSMKWPVVIMAVLWPSFVMSGTEVIVFYLYFVPEELFSCADEELVSHCRLSIYSISFFLGWALNALVSSLCIYFTLSGLNVSLRGD
jgi:hypothetical protein